MKLFKIFSLITAMLVLCAGSALAKEATHKAEKPRHPMTERGATGMIKKIESFTFFVDQSGSMMMTGKDFQQNKMDVAKEVLSRVNDKIPMLGYSGGLHTFAKFREIQPVTPYNKEQMQVSIGKLRDNLEIFGRLTPMGRGLYELAPVIGNMARPAAIIIVSDGDNNAGMDPVAEARALYAENPNICFHIISLADNAHGRDVLNQIARLNNCTVMVDAKDLLMSEAAVDKFVADVFYTHGGGEKIVLRSVQFEFDSSKITSASAAILDEVSAIIKNQPRHVQIDGHTCNIGTAAYNQGLSERRAASVKHYLEGRGVPGSMMSTAGYGLHRPKYDNSTEEGRRLNRRAEIDFK